MFLIHPKLTQAQTLHHMDLVRQGKGMHLLDEPCGADSLISRVLPKPLTERFPPVHWEACDPQLLPGQGPGSRGRERRSGAAAESCLS